MKKLFIFLLCLSITTVIEAREIPVEDFFKDSTIISLNVSPDGKHYAATVKINGNTQLAVLDAKTKQIKARFNFKRDNLEIGRFGWFNNERIYATMIRKIGPLAQAARTGYLFAGSIDGTKKVQLLPAPKKPGRSAERPRNYNFMNFLRDEPRNILISMSKGGFTEVYKLDVYTGSRRKVDKSPEKNASLRADHNHEVRVSVSRDPDEEKVRIHTRKKNSKEWELLNEYDDKSVGISPMSFTKDNDHVYLNVREKGKKRGIYLLNLNTKKMDLVYEIEGDADLSGSVFDGDYRTPELVGIQMMPGYLETHFFDPSHPRAKLQAGLQAAFPGEQVDIINHVADGTKALVRVWSDRRPGRFFMMDTKSFKLEYLLDVRDWIKPEEMAEMKPFSFKARDGLEIRGYLTLPKGKSKNLPLVQYVHGGPFGVQDEWRYDRAVQFLANRGYAVMQVNYRGSGGRGSDFIYDNYKKMGREMQDDLTDAVLWSVKEGIVDKERVCIYGASYGGYAAMMGPIREPDLYKCAIPYVGVYDIRAFKYDIYHKSRYGRKNEEEAWGYGDEAFMAERSPRDHVNKLKAALFLVHGKDDPICPMEHYYSLTEALDEIDYPYESLVKPFEGHGFRNPENNYELYTKIEKFLEKHIGS
ncbi:S9 family peptidase [Pleionea sp. CnH1-48]|uniref:alpha/beta hydrolase family protein n=1 Tax=Pleionea sp. CnH1-48 TaxID=2954494 RepID=UPI0020974F8F|nr:alpha/beta fold hydrolase [Pleionea sp. CnH1-48]MCO7227089.1 prolyl oligopeptidase family serine peptidase [Pleionea sp. CnH1-48]